MEKNQARLLSVVIPAYNAEIYINKCVESVLNQSYQSIELIVVNDCSNDKTKCLLDEMSKKDIRLTVIHLEENVGIHAARAVGLNAATGEYIGFIDSDDWIAPGAYENMLQEAQSNQADIVICGTDIVNEEGKFLKTYTKFLKREVHTNNLLNLFCNFYFGPGVLWNKIYHARLIKKYGALQLERKNDASEDYIVNIGCFDEANKIILLPNNYYHYLIRDNSASRLESNAKNFCRILTAYITCLEKYSHFNSQKLLNIDLLYTGQLRFKNYYISDLEYLESYSSELKTCLNDLSRIRPQSIYQLIHCFDIKKKTKRQKAKNLTRFLYKKFRTLYMKKKVYN